jgi:hypothetical protein
MRWRRRSRQYGLGKRATIGSAVLARRGALGEGKCDPLLRITARIGRILRTS